MKEEGDNPGPWARVLQSEASAEGRANNSASDRQAYLADHVVP